MSAYIPIPTLPQEDGKVMQPLDTFRGIDRMVPLSFQSASLVPPQISQKSMIFIMTFSVIMSMDLMKTQMIL